jgi:choline monooxygenase
MPGFTPIPAGYDGSRTRSSGAAGNWPPPFTEVFQDIGERIAPIDLTAMRFAKRDRYQLACNWKVYVDNFLEGYHLPYVHPGLSQVLDYRVYETELQTLMPLS